MIIGPLKMHFGQCVKPDLLIYDLSNRYKPIGGTSAGASELHRDNTDTHLAPTYVFIVGQGLCVSMHIINIIIAVVV